MDLDELVQHWTLLDDERELAAGKRGPTRLGFALLLKFHAGTGRFPRGRSELAGDTVEFVARQPGVPASDLGFHEWSGRTSEYHRAQVRRRFWFRECSAEDGGKLTEWLAASVCQAERRADRVRGELLTRCRAERIEPPSAGRCDRIIRSARTPARLAELAATAGNDEADNGELQALSLIKSVPGNVSLESMLTEIAKLDAVPRPGCRTRQRQAARDRRQRWSPNRRSRPRAKMARAIQQNARSGSAGTVSQPTQEWSL